MSDPSALGRQGGDLRAHRHQVLDLSTCVNPDGPPPEVGEALRLLSAEDLRIHPYESEELLGQMYALHLGVPLGELVVGRGTTEFLWKLVERWPAVRTAVPLPAYTDFIRAFPGRAIPTQTPVDGITLEVIDAAMADNDMVVISNPSNPTGQLLSVRGLAAVAERWSGCLLVVDESYAEFWGGAEPSTLIGAAPPNVLALRSPSKFYAVAATRVGVAWTKDPEVKQRLSTARGPWPISGLDARIGAAAITAQAWAIEARQRLTAAGHGLEGHLDRLGGRVSRGSQVHFRLWEPPIDAQVVQQRLFDAGIAVRRLGRAHGFSTEVLRITAPSDNRRSMLESALGRAAA